MTRRNRTRVTAVKGRCPRPLDDGANDTRKQDCCRMMVQGSTLLRKIGQGLVSQGIILGTRIFETVCAIQRNPELFAMQKSSVAGQQQ